MEFVGRIIRALYRSRQDMTPAARKLCRQSHIDWALLDSYVDGWLDSMSKSKIAFWQLSASCLDNIDDWHHNWIAFKNAPEKSAQ